MKVLWIACLVLIFASSALAGSGVAFGRDGVIYYQYKKLVKGEFPTLSPNGKQIAFCASRGFTSNDPKDAAIMVVDVSSAKQTAILRPGALVLDPKWSPKGDRIAFILLDEGGRNLLHTVRPNGNDRWEVTSSGKYEIGSMWALSWASDGKSLYFHDMVNLYNVTTSGALVSKTPLTKITGKANVVTSSDSFIPCPTNPKLLAITFSVPGTPKFDEVFHEPNTALFLYDMTKKIRTRLTPADMLAIDPVWSSDGKYIYFCGYREADYYSKNPFHIYRIGANGKGLIEVARGENPSQ